MNIGEKLTAIQTAVKAPKNLYNSFGKYNYRNAESILEALKPYLKQVNASLTVSDEIIMVGDRFYVRATVELIDNEDLGSSIRISALAREEAEKKGMDGSQVTGTASSYARKYALNGMFLLDDTKDADSDEYHEQTHAEPKAKPEPPKMPKFEEEKPEVLSAEEAQQISLLAESKGVAIEDILNRYHVKTLTQLTVQQFSSCISALKKSGRKETA